MRLIWKSAVAAGLPLLLASLSLTVEACEKAPPRSAATGGAADGTDAALELAVSKVDTTVTLGDWLRQNPHDSLSAQLTSVREDKPVCQVSIGKSNYANRELTRFAIFNISPPADEKLPEDTTAIINQLCRLRTVFFESEESDSAKLAAMSDSLRSAVDAKLGYGRRADIYETARTGWIRAWIWKPPQTTVILAIAPADTGLQNAIRRNQPPAKPSFSRGKLVLFGLAPHSGMSGNDYWTTRHREAAGLSDEALRGERVVIENADAKRDLEDADSAIAWASLPRVTADLNVMLAEIRRRNDYPGTREPEADSALLRALRAIRDTAPKLEPSRRAAALLAGDLVKYATFPDPDAVPEAPEGTDTPDRLLFVATQSIILGADVDRSANSYWFNRAWLWDAYELDSLGRAGHLAFVRLLKRGFNKGAECADGVDFYLRVIDRGEADIRRGDTDPLIQYYVGVAYKSIFDYSEQAPRTASSHNPSKAEGESARVKAIDHLRASLVGLRDKQTRRDAWVIAANLLLRKPGQPAYQCASEHN